MTLHSHYLDHSIFRMLFFDLLYVFVVLVVDQFSLNNKLNMENVDGSSRNFVEVNAEDEDIVNNNTSSDGERRFNMSKVFQVISK